MTEKKLTVPRGAQVSMEIADDYATQSGGKKAQNEGRGVGVVDIEEQNYVLKKKEKTRFAFFDLGTRLRSMPPDFAFSDLEVREFPSSDMATPDDGNYSEYIEQRFEAQGVPLTEGSTEEVNPTTAEWESLDHILLGSRADDGDVVDPLGTSMVNGSSRLVSNSAEFSIAHIQQAVPSFFLLASNELAPQLSIPSISSDPVYAGPSFPTQYIPDELMEIGKLTERTSQPADIGERWNPRNLTSGLAQQQAIFDVGYFPQNGRDLLFGFLSAFSPVPIYGTVFLPSYVGNSFSGVMHYHGFFTRDTISFKITNSPSYGAAEVNYQFKARDEIYLRPIIQPVKLGTHSRWVAKRLSLYPSTLGTYVTGQTKMDVIPMRSLYSDAAGADIGDELTELTGQFWLRVGGLVAIIKQDNKVFYIWSKKDMKRFVA